MKIVLFLGAGFSRAFGLPVMREFFDIANASDFLSDKQKEFLRRLRKRAADGESMITGARDNLEHVLSFALRSPDVPGLDDDPGVSAYDYLCEILRKVYATIPQVVGPQEHSKRLKSLLGIEDATWNHELTTITTNYDVVAEFMLWRLGLAPDLPGDWESVPEENVRKVGRLYGGGERPSLMCKLHGSLNFFSSPEDPSRFLVHDHIAEVDYITGRDLRSRAWPRVCFTKYEPNATPLLVPPTFFKIHVAPCVEPMWDAAHRALHVADRIVFIGYSFPPSDTDTKYFLTSALVDNIDLRHVDVIGPSANAVVQRLRDSPSGYGNHFKQLLRPFDFAWQEGKYCVLSA